MISVKDNESSSNKQYELQNLGRIVNQSHETLWKNYTAHRISNGGAKYPTNRKPNGAAVYSGTSEWRVQCLLTGELSEHN